MRIEDIQEGNTVVHAGKKGEIIKVEGRIATIQWEDLREPIEHTFSELNYNHTRLLVKT